MSGFSGLAGHGFWAAKSRILDAQDVTDFGRSAGALRLCWAVEEGSVVTVEGGSVVAVEVASVGGMEGRVARMPLRTWRLSRAR